VHLNFKKILLFFLFLFLTLSVSNIVFSKSIDEEIADIQKQINDINNAIAPLQKESTGLQSKITSAKSQITKIEKEVDNLSQKLIDKEADLEVQKLLLGERVKRYYKNSKKFNPLIIFFTNNESSSLLQQYTWYQAIINQDKNTITQYNTDIKTLNDNKTKLEGEKTKLATLKKSLESRFGFLAGEIQKAETYKNKLTQDLLNLEAQRIDSLNLPTSAFGTLSCVDDRTIDPGFGTGFAFFTFGIPHHVGLNQYGAQGRAKAGQNYKDILNAYFNNISIEKKSNITIKVDGFGSMSLEQYMLGIYEVPNDWPIEALKAQAVAARSYAMAFTNSGANSICTTQKCQVYKGGNKGGNWEQAVKATEGEVLTQNGQIVKAYFASTAGGYTYLTTDINWPGSNPSFIKRTRDTSGEINSFDDLKNKAYDKESPCFYSAQGWRTNESGKKTAWLKPSEVADIINATLLGQADSSTQKHLCQIDVSGGRCKVGNESYEVWSSDKVKEELKNKGGTVCNTVNSTSLSFDFNNGKTTQISFICDSSSHSFDGSTFKSYFNARAPANISIVGPLFNVEKR